MLEGDRVAEETAKMREKFHLTVDGIGRAHNEATLVRFQEMVSEEVEREVVLGEKVKERERSSLAIQKSRQDWRERNQRSIHGNNMRKFVDQEAILQRDTVRRKETDDKIESRVADFLDQEMEMIRRDRVVESKVGTEQRGLRNLGELDMRATITKHGQNLFPGNSPINQSSNFYKSDDENSLKRMKRKEIQEQKAKERGKMADVQNKKEREVDRLERDLGRMVDISKTLKELRRNENDKRNIEKIQRQDKLEESLMKAQERYPERNVPNDHIQWKDMVSSSWEETIPIWRQEDAVKENEDDNKDRAGELSESDDQLSTSESPDISSSAIELSEKSSSLSTDSIMTSEVEISPPQENLSLDQQLLIDNNRTASISVLLNELSDDLGIPPLLLTTSNLSSNQLSLSQISEESRKNFDLSLASAITLKARHDKVSPNQTQEEEEEEEEEEEISLSLDDEESIYSFNQSGIDHRLEELEEQRNQIETLRSRVSSNSALSLSTSTISTSLPSSIASSSIQSLFSDLNISSPSQYFSLSTQETSSDIDSTLISSSTATQESKEDLSPIEISRNQAINPDIDIIEHDSMDELSIHQLSTDDITELSCSTPFKFMEQDK